MIDLLVRHQFGVGLRLDDCRRPVDGLVGIRVLGGDVLEPIFIQQMLDQLDFTILETIVVTAVGFAGQCCGFTA